MSATFDCNFYKDYFKDLDRGERIEIIPISGSSADSFSVPYKCGVSYLEEVSAGFLVNAQAEVKNDNLNVSSHVSCTAYYMCLENSFFLFINRWQLH